MIRSGRGGGKNHNKGMLINEARQIIDSVYQDIENGNIIDSVGTLYRWAGTLRTDIDAYVADMQRKTGQPITVIAPWLADRVRALQKEVQQQKAEV